MVPGTNKFLLSLCAVSPIKPQKHQARGKETEHCGAKIFISCKSSTSVYEPVYVCMCIDIYFGCKFV
jgi:hypothetical protein